jgi:hypothetical protein
MEKQTIYLIIHNSSKELNKKYLLKTKNKKQKNVKGLLRIESSDVFTCPVN